jgi:hypothetical protein
MRSAYALRMIATLLANGVLVVHGLFILFVLVGGLGVWRWPRLAWLHIPAVAWAAWVAWAGWICPLTPLENSLRRAAGEAGYSGGFIEHYLLPAIYPKGLTRGAQIGLGVFVAVLNVSLYAMLVARRRRTRAASTAGQTDHLASSLPGPIES